MVLGFATLSDAHWSLSGEVVLMTLLGGMGTYALGRGLRGPQGDGGVRAPVVPQAQLLAEQVQAGVVVGRLAQQRDNAAFEAEITAMNAYKSHAGMAEMAAQSVPAPDLVQLAEHVARGRLHYARGDYAAAIEQYRKGKVKAQG